MGTPETTYKRHEEQQNIKPTDDNYQQPAKRHHPNKLTSNLDLLSKKRQLEQENRHVLTSADASRLYQSSNKINNDIDRRRAAAAIMVGQPQ